MGTKLAATADCIDTARDANEDFKMNIIPVECLDKAKADILNFFENNKLNELESRFYKDDCMLDLPELPFKPISIIIIAAKMSMKLAVFNHSGKSVTDLFRVREINIDHYLNNLFTAKGYHLVNEHKLPQKRLAVCSGLAKYGKNNLAYIDGWGSFIQLETYISDVPYDSDYTWGEVRDMEQCASCGVCMRKCPGGAITNDRFLLNMGNCHGWLEVIGRLPESAPRVIAPCSVCQRFCPKNSKWRSEAETVEFSESETECLLSIHEKPANPYSMSPDDEKKLLYGWDYPDELVKKVMKIGIQPRILSDIPNRLNHMFAHSKE